MPKVRRVRVRLQRGRGLGDFLTNAKNWLKNLIPKRHNGAAARGAQSPYSFGGRRRRRRVRGGIVRPQNGVYPPGIVF